MYCSRSGSQKGQSVGVTGVVGVRQWKICLTTPRGALDCSLTRQGREAQKVNCKKSFEWHGVEWTMIERREPLKKSELITRRVIRITAWVEIQWWAPPCIVNRGNTNSQGVDNWSWDFLVFTSLYATPETFFGLFKALTQFWDFRDFLRLLLTFFRWKIHLQPRLRIRVRLRKSLWSLNGLLARSEKISEVIHQLRPNPRKVMPCLRHSPPP